MAPLDDSTRDNVASSGSSESSQTQNVSKVANPDKIAALEVTDVALGASS